MEETVKEKQVKVKNLTLKQFTSGMTDDRIECEIEWIREARAEGYSWKQLAKSYNVSPATLKKFVNGK